jgi:hypothetical protein
MALTSHQRKIMKELTPAGVKRIADTVLTYLDIVRDKKKNHAKERRNFKQRHARRIEKEFGPRQRDFFLARIRDVNTVALTHEQMRRAKARSR